MKILLAFTLFGLAQGSWLFRNDELANSTIKKWTTLKTTFSLTPFMGFHGVPQTVKDALKDNWVSISQTCDNGGQYAGFRYIHKADTAVTLLFDANGFIAGIQMNPKTKELLVSGNDYQFGNVSMFTRNNINMDNVFTLTAYFVDPSTICSGGRTASDIETQGIGSQLYFQNGPNPSDLIVVPRSRQGALEQGWSPNMCFPAMGVHTFFQSDKFQDSNCTQTRPAFLLFDKSSQSMIGFGFQVFGEAKSNWYEYPPLMAIKKILGEPIPECILDKISTTKMTTMHVYFVDPLTIWC